MNVKIGRPQHGLTAWILLSLCDEFLNSLVRLISTTNVKSVIQQSIQQTKQNKIKQNKKQRKAKKNKNTNHKTKNTKVKQNTKQTKTKQSRVSILRSFCRHSFNVSEKKKTFILYSKIKCYLVVGDTQP